MSLFDRLPPEMKALGVHVADAIQTLQQTLDEGTKRNARDALDRYEDLNSKLIAERKRSDRVEEALRTGARLDQYGEPSYPRAGYDRDTPEYKSFMHWLSKGSVTELNYGSKWDPKQIDLKTLRTDSLTAGGYLVPQVMDDHIRKHLTEVSPVRQHARVRTAAKKSMDLPVRLSLPLAQFEGEAETAPTDQSIYGSESVTCYRQTVKVPATLDMMVSSAFDLETEIASDTGESFAQGEGLNFVKGNGRKSPQGFVSDSRVVGFTSSTSGDFTIDDLAKMAGGLKRGQYPWWFMNRKTLAHIQTLKSSIGVPIWQPAAGPLPATIWNHPYDSNMIDLDDVSLISGAKPIVFADLYRGYEIFDMIGMSVVRDDITKADQAVTTWTFRRYLAGRVILPEAISVMTLL
jgi:HK97 family phage major capsid protein